MKALIKNLFKIVVNELLLKKSIMYIRKIDSLTLNIWNWTRKFWLTEVCKTLNLISLFIAGSYLANNPLNNPKSDLKTNIKYI